MPMRPRTPSGSPWPSSCFHVRPPSVGFVDSAARAAAGRYSRACEAPATAPHKACANFGIEGDVDGAGLFIFVENLLPGLAAIGRAKDSALFVRPERMSERRDENDVGIVRIDDQRGRCGACHRVRCASRSCPPSTRFVHAIAKRNVAANAGLARAHVNDVRIGGRDRNRSDRGNRLLVEKRRPGEPAVRRLPHAAGHRAEIIDIRLTRDARHSQHAPAAERPHQPPLHPLQRLVLERLGSGPRRTENAQKDNRCQT